MTPAKTSEPKPAKAKKDLFGGGLRFLLNANTGKADLTAEKGYDPKDHGQPPSVRLRKPWVSENEEAEKAKAAAAQKDAPSALGGEYRLKIEPQKSDIRFSDLAGVDEAIEQCAEIVDYLKDREKYIRLNAKIPKGTLLKGPPGTGKTLLAQAVAGEAGVPFYAFSGSDFDEKLVGVGASRIRELFTEARKNKPCIIFIDEIDSLGKKRGGMNDSQTLNAFLVELDGFQKENDVILMGATNRDDILDPALLRPGRFSRRTSVPLPDEKGRRKILDIYVKKTQTEGPIDTAVLAKAAYDFSGAMLANVVNEAALLVIREKREFVTQSDLLAALQDEALGGREVKSRSLSDAVEERTAYHEAGHAVIALHDGLRKILKGTVVPRQNSLGHVWSVPVTDDFAYDFLVQDMVMMMGGRAAEECHFKSILDPAKGNISPGAGGGPGSDIYNATERARRMVTEWGMSDLGPVNYEGNSQTAAYGRSPVAETTATEIDAEIRKIVNNAHDKALAFLKDHWTEVEQVAAAFRMHKTLTGGQIADAAAGRPPEQLLPPPVPAQAPQQPGPA